MVIHVQLPRDDGRARPCCHVLVFHHVQSCGRLTVIWRTCANSGFFCTSNNNFACVKDEDSPASTCFNFSPCLPELMLITNMTSETCGNRWYTNKHTYTPHQRTWRWRCGMSVRSTTFHDTHIPITSHMISHVQIWGDMHACKHEHILLWHLIHTRMWRASSDWLEVGHG